MNTEYEVTTNVNYVTLINPKRALELFRDMVERHPEHGLSLHHAGFNFYMMSKCEDPAAPDADTAICMGKSRYVVLKDAGVARLHI